MKYTTYDSATGAVQQIYDLPDSDHVAANLANKSWIPGDWSGHYIESGSPVVLPADPSTALAPYEFDYQSKSWQLNRSSAEFQIRSERNKLLTDIDRVNPIWYASLSADQQQELSTYRQALLAVPQQSGFPETVTWPIKPTWL